MFPTLPPYPNETDVMSALPVLMAELTGNRPPLPKAVHAGVIVLSYGLSRVLPDTDSPPAATLASRPTLARLPDNMTLDQARAELAQHLQPLHTARLGDGSFIKSLPWGVILPLVWKVVQGALVAA